MESPKTYRRIWKMYKKTNAGNGKEGFIQPAAGFQF